MFKRAKMEWRLPIEPANPAHQIIRPASNPPHRERRVTDDELDTVVRQLGWDETAAPDLLTEWVAWCATWFALQTAMRRGEILSMEWKHVKERYVHLPITKNGDARNVPLSSKGRELFGLLHRVGTHWWSR